MDRKPGSRAHQPAGCRLLLDTRMRVIDVAHTVGFDNLSHFNRIFKRLLGMTPRSFRTNAMDGIGAGNQ